MDWGSIVFATVGAFIATLGAAASILTYAKCDQYGSPAVEFGEYMNRGGRVSRTILSIGMILFIGGLILRFF
jgi:hypothetical protein